jgi:hypothetical protein
VSLYAATLVFFVLFAALLFADPGREKRYFYLLLLFGLLSLGFAGAALGFTKRLWVDGAQLIVNSALGSQKYAVENASLAYVHTGTGTRSGYMLVLKTPKDRPVRLLSLGQGMDMQKEIDTGKWIADTLGLPFAVAPNIVQAANIQANTFIAPKHIPFIIIGFVFVLGAVSVVASMFFDRGAKRTTQPTEIHFVCSGHNSFKVDGKVLRLRGSFKLSVKPGHHRVQLKTTAGWQTYRIRVLENQSVEFRCASPPRR